LKKQTTKELVGDYIDLESQKLFTDSESEEMEYIDSQLEITKQSISRKLDGIDHFMLDIDKRMYMIDAEVEALNSEIHRLKTRKKATESLKKYFNQTLIPLIVEEVGNDGVYETDTARYKLYETDGPVIIHEKDEIPDSYKNMKYVESINKIKIRKDLKEGKVISGASMPKIKRVKRS